MRADEDIRPYGVYPSGSWLYALYPLSPEMVTPVAGS